MRVKLLTIFLLAISAVALVGYISYEGLSKLMISLESTTRPDYRKEHFNDLIYSLSEAENSVRVYTITRESKYLGPFYSAINEVDHQMEILYRYAKGDKVLAAHLDTIHSLIEKKIELHKKLIELKEDLTQIDVYQQVLEKIETIEKKNEEVDSLENAIIELNREEKIEEQKEVAEEKPEKKGFLRKLFNFNKKNEANEGKVSEALTSADSLLRKTDTLTQMIDTLKKEKISMEIKSSLVEIKTKEQELNKSLTQAELSLTKKDQEISDLIKLEVRKVQRYFDSEKIKTAEQASDLFEETTQLIKIVGTVSAMLFLVLVFIILNDIQVNQRFRKRLENAKKRAEDLAAAKEDFLSNMSHEIRTPLNAILGFTEQLNASSLQQSQQKHLKIIKNASQHLLSIINDILDYNKLEAGKIKIEKIPFSVAENANIVYDTLLINAQNKDLNFKLNIDEYLQGKCLLGDAVRFRQILFNLAGNAIKFTEKGSVEINLLYKKRKLNPALEMTVKDSGIGMTENEAAIVFNKFDQADQTISKKYGGTGLGLSIVKKLTDLQKGSISVESQPSKGSSFKVVLPYPIIEDNREMLTTPPDKARNNLENKQVLIVDDEEYNVLLFETILKKHKTRTFSANSGKEALEILKNEKFDLILLDLQMKEMDGFQTIAVIRKSIHKETPILAITASVSQAIHKKCLESGFNDIIIKPVSEKEFIGSVAKYCHSEAQPENGKSVMEAKKVNNLELPKNLNQVFELVQNDEALAINMISIYLKNITKTREIFRESLKEKNYDAIREASHKVIPSTRHMGFEELATKLKFAENNVNNIEELDSNKNHIEEICSNIDSVIEWLTDFLKKHESQNSVVS